MPARAMMAAESPPSALMVPSRSDALGQPVEAFFDGVAGFVVHFILDRAVSPDGRSARIVGQRRGRMHKGSRQHSQQCGGSGGQRQDA